jgi:hypothetical protein
LAGGLGQSRPDLAFYPLGITRRCTRLKDAVDALAIDHDADVFAAFFVFPD